MTRHRETVFPFSTFDRVLSGCNLNPDLPAESEHGPDRWITTPEDVESGFGFNLELDCDWEAITRQTDWRLKHLSLEVRLRNERLKRAQSIVSWPAEEIPFAHDFRGLDTGLDFRIDVSLINSEHRQRLGAPDVFAGTVVANRCFTFNTSGFRFPMEYADFAGRGWPADALWHVEFEDVESLDAPADECLTVYINEKVRHLFDGKTREQRAAMSVFTAVTGRLIFTDVARTALIRGLIGEDAAEGLAQSIVATLERQGGPRIETWRGWATDPSLHDEFTSSVLNQLSAAESLRG